MANFETLGILKEIEALVSDKLQVVFYKRPSRNYLVSSNAAKRLLQEFMEKNESGFEVVYTLSVWVKNNPSVYQIKLVHGLKLAVCLDGTLPGYHIHHSYGSGANNWLIQLEEVEKTLPQTCLDHLNSTSCFFPQNVVSNIKTLLFILNAAYDAWQASLTPPLADPLGSWNDCKSNHAHCNSSQIQFLQDFRNQMINAVKVSSMSKQNGLFI